MTVYAKGKIYKMMFDEDQTYVGSTIQLLHKRLYEHKKNPHGNIKILMEANKDVRIVLVEKFPCSDREELRQREQHWIDLLKPSLNTIRAHTTKEQARAYQKEYNQRPEVQARQKEYADFLKKPPPYCETCSRRLTHHNIKMHCNSITHRIYYKRAFLDIFEMEITDAEIPSWL